MADMREILFNGKRVDNGEWVEGYLSKTTICGSEKGAYNAFVIYKATDKLFKQYGYEIDPETVGQFTGLYDSTKWEELTESEQKEWLKCHTKDEWKGKKIFEGDVLKNKLGYYVVIWDDKYLQWAVKNQKGVICFTLNTIISDKKRPCTAIGNIHDNPEPPKGEDVKCWSNEKQTKTN